MQLLLLPFSWLYGFVTDCRNYFYEKEIWKISTFKKPIINVGNLTVGGTGKSPHVEYLIRLLQNRFTVATLSRGYGRKTKGFILADSNATAQTIGDEPLQFYQKYCQKTAIYVGENRVEALKNIFSTRPETNVVILDDAFQHRPVKPALNLLLMDSSRPIDTDYPFPVGRLRERRHGAKRADAVIVTKCPNDLSIANQELIKQKLSPYLKKDTPFFFTKIIYGKPQNCRLEDGNDKLEKTLLLSGIANPKPFEDYCKEHFEVIDHLVFKDHHDFTEKDLMTITTILKNTSATVLMTEKDMVKFQPFLNHTMLKNTPLYYLPIEIGFVEAKSKDIFDEMIFKVVSSQ